MGKQKALSRVYEINNILLQRVTSIYRLRKIGFSRTEGKSVYAYAISLVKSYEYTPEELVDRFYITCRDMLAEGETLTTGEKEFIVSSKEFVVHYYLELWRKSADKIAYIEDGCVKIEFLHRMSCEQAAFIFKKHNVDPFVLMDELDFLQKYNSYAERYVGLAKRLNLLGPDRVRS